MRHERFVFGDFTPKRAEFIDVLPDLDLLKISVRSYNYLYFHYPTSWRSATNGPCFDFETSEKPQYIIQFEQKLAPHFAGQNSALAIAFTCPPLSGTLLVCRESSKFIHHTTTLDSRQVHAFDARILSFDPRDDPSLPYVDILRTNST